MNSIERLHQDLWEMLLCFDEFCRRHDLQYWLDGGTLLGAIREQGFIPWDTDVDVCMPADDYLRLIKLGESGKLPARLMLQKRKHKKLMKMVQIVDNNHRAHLDAFVALPLDESKWLSCFYALGLICDIKRDKEHNLLLRHILQLVVKQIIYGGEKRHQRAGMKDAPHIAHASASHRNKSLWKTSEVFPLVKKEFEGKMFPVPANFDDYLKSFYGDYWQLPPDSERKALHNESLMSAPPVIKKRTRIYTSGIFDLFHVGHLRAIQAGIALENLSPDEVYLIVGVGNDASAGEYKRPPVIPFEQRKEIVAAVKGVDEVIEAPNYPDEEFYKTLRIHLHYQGEEDDTMSFYETAKSLGIMRFVGRQGVTSTTEIMNRVLSSYPLA